MTNSIIRKASVSDALRMAELSETLGYPVESEVIEQRLERLLSRPEHLILVAELPLHGVAGWIHATEQEILEVGRAGEIVGLVVAADQRGNGIGRLLVEQIEQWALARGLKQISVRSNVLRMESHPFYERLGYARVKTQHVYRKDIRQKRARS
jgi:GNAT superfamily N-acetyltransferase